ncbi:SPOR domain-containing protein [Neobacillus dielmonensis]|uniref:SPOR domain-containing protein n=1 Tax=Neobacillus dielmonensis TaxID=1347369 RepID=UPI0005A69B69|nr:SPOR domain-containing protein [Neobacillus dielmonensis]
MDKPRKNGHTITVKINGEQKDYQETTKNKDTEDNNIPSLNGIKTSDNEPNQEVFLETAAAQESVEESFDWIIPEPSDKEKEEILAKPTSITKSKISNPFYPKNRIGKPIRSILTTAFFAILIGTTIGLFMLNLVSVKPDEEPAASSSLVQEETNKGTTETTNQSSATIKEFTTYLVQGGIFTTTEGAKKTADQLTAEGVPSQIFEMDGKHYIFIGAADSIEGAKKLSADYKASGVKDAFAKPFVLKEKKVADLADGDKKFMESVPSIYQALSQAVANDSAPAIDEQSLKIADLKNDNVKKLKTALSSAFDNIQSYQKSKDTKKRTEAQESLLNFLSIYYSM